LLRQERGKDWREKAKKEVVKKVLLITRKLHLDALVQLATVLCFLSVEGLTLSVWLRRWYLAAPGASKSSKKERPSVQGAFQERPSVQKSPTASRCA
jgi:hypothetical protein